MHIKPIPDDVSAVKPTRPHDHPSRVGGTRALLNPFNHVLTAAKAVIAEAGQHGKSSKKESNVPACCKAVSTYEFEYNMFRKIPRNPKLKYRKDGDIDHDPSSRAPKYCDYNAVREVIRQAKQKGLDHVHWRTSVATAREIIKDGYTVWNDDHDTISWSKKFDPTKLNHRKLDSAGKPVPCNAWINGTSGSAGTSGSSGSSGRSGRPI